MGLAGVYSPTPEIVGGTGLVLLAAGAPVVASQAAQGREVLHRSGIEMEDSAGRTAGWITYGTGVVSALGVIGWGLAGGGSDAAALGILPVVLCTTSVVLFEGDASRVREKLESAVAEAPSGPPRATVAFAPTMLPSGNDEPALPGLVAEVRW